MSTWMFFANFSWLLSIGGYWVVINIPYEPYYLTDVLHYSHWTNKVLERSVEATFTNME